MNGHYFIITLYLKTGVYKLSPDLINNLKKLSPQIKKGYEILSHRKQITTSEYQVAMKIPARTARYQLNKMIEADLIISEFAGKATIYLKMPDPLSNPKVHLNYLPLLSMKS